ALGIAERHDLARLATVQAYYTIAGRDVERELVPMMRSEGVGLLVWGPLASGILADKYDRKDGQREEGRRNGFDFPPVDRTRARAVLDVMRPMATSRGVSVAQVAIAWLLHQPAVTSVLVGARRNEQL